jgi:hypothetical protein
MYTYTHTYTYIYIYIYIYICTHTHTHIYIYTYIHPDVQIGICICMYVYIYVVYVCVCARACVSECVCVYVCMYAGKTPALSDERAAFSFSSAVSTLMEEDTCSRPRISARRRCSSLCCVCVCVCVCVCSSHKSQYHRVLTVKSHYIANNFVLRMCACRAFWRTWSSSAPQKSPQKKESEYHRVWTV